jgi:hypothetical protein
MKDSRDPGTIDAFSFRPRQTYREALDALWKRHPGSKPGPKPTGKAKTNAQRQADFRARQRARLDELEAMFHGVKGRK